MEIVIASENLHKVRELRDMFRSLKLSFDILSLKNFPDYTPPKETGNTFEENARLKAEHAAKTLNKICLADDSGLVVPSLGGAPGVYSRRYAGKNASFKDNRKKLLKELEGKEGIERSAYFECVLSLAGPSIKTRSVSGICEGYITKKEKGSHGFGYDSIFCKNDYEKTLAELDEATKNKISHRRKAFDKVALILESLKKELHPLS